MTFPIVTSERITFVKTYILLFVRGSLTVTSNEETFLPKLEEMLPRTTCIIMCSTGSNNQPHNSVPTTAKEYYMYMEHEYLHIIYIAQYACRTLFSKMSLEIMKQMFQNFGGNLELRTKVVSHTKKQRFFYSSV